MDDNIIRRLHFACRITKAVDTHSEDVALLAFPRQKWFREHALMFVRSLPVLLIKYSFEEYRYYVT